MNHTINGNEVTINGKAVMLNRKQVSVFAALYSASPLVVLTADLMTAAQCTRQHTLAQYVSTMRKKLDGLGVTIQTHSKVGYALKIKGI